MFSCFIYCFSSSLSLSRTRSARCPNKCRVVQHPELKDYGISCKTTTYFMLNSFYVFFKVIRYNLPIRLKPSKTINRT